MGVSLKQAGFGGGQLSPDVLGLTGQQKYAVGLAECSNAWVTRYGTVENRPGSQYQVATKVGANRVREVPFIFSSAVSYLLEFGANYIRPLRNGARISVVGAAAYAGGTTYAVGDLVTYSGVVYYSRVAANIGNQPDISPTQWYVEAGGLLEIPTDLPQAALQDFQYVQQNDIMTVASQLVAPRQLQRFSNTKWAWVPFVPTTGIGTPQNVMVTAGSPSSSLPTPGSRTATGGIAGANTDWYRVTAYTASTQSEASTPFRVLPGPNIEATGGNPITVGWASGGGGPTGYAIYKFSTPTPGTPTVPYGLIAIVPAGTLSYIDDASQSIARPVALSPSTTGGGTEFTYEVTAVSSGGTESLVSASASAVGGTPTDANPNVITWDPVTGAITYRVYRVVGGVPGFIGETPMTSFNDTNFLPDTAVQPPTDLPIFQTVNDYPAVVGYYQQRLMFGNTINQPQTVMASRVGNYYAFTVSTPIQDDDAITFTIAGRQVQPIRALVDLGKLVIHTSNAEYICGGNQAGILTPLAIGLIANGSSGSTLIAPVVLGNTDLFVQDTATRLLDLRYEVQSFSYAGKDLTKFAAQIFAGRTIVDMAWQKLPHSIVWCVLDNGTLAALTYVREDELWAWHVHETTNGSFENVAVVPEGTQFVVYVVVKRTINGATVRYIERLADRACLDTVFFTDSVFVDSALTYDGRNTGSTTITATLGTGWTPIDTVTLTASASTFSLADIGNRIVFTQTDSDTGLVDDVVSFQIVGYTSATVVTAMPLRDVPTWAQATALTTWGKAVRTFTGMDHLEGQDLAILADGSVVANPLNVDLPLVVVSGGAFVLTEPAVVVTAGLVLQTDIETLPVENAAGETIANKYVQVREVTPIFSKSRGGEYGQDVDHLNAWKQPTEVPYGYPPNAVTGNYRIPIQGSSKRFGSCVIRNTDPVPWSMSAIVISGEVS